MRSGFDASGDNAGLDGSLAQAAKQASASEQIVFWDQSVRGEYAIALYDLKAQRLLPLSDVEVGRLLTRDRLIAREWRKWQAMMGNKGSLVVIDVERARQTLASASDDDDIAGLA
jgi:hypothetical protein